MFNGFVPTTNFEKECLELGLVPSQVAIARSFGRDMIAEALEPECNDNGFRGSCGCRKCTGSRKVDLNNIPF